MDPDEVLDAAAAADPTQYNAFVHGLAVNEVSCIKVHGERLEAGEPANVEFDFGGGFKLDPDGHMFRYDVEARIVDATRKVLTVVQVSVVMVATSPAPADESVLNQFAVTSGAMIVQPFLREAVMSTADRMGHHGIVVPILRWMPNQADVQV